MFFFVLGIGVCYCGGRRNGDLVIGYIGRLKFSCDESDDCEWVLAGKGEYSDSNAESVISDGIDDSGVTGAGDE